MKNGILLGVIILSLFSCKEQSDYDGYSVTESGLNYKIHTIGEPNQTIHDSDVVGLKFYIYSMSDSLIYKSQKTIMYRNLKDTSWNEFVGLLALHDSATLIMDVTKLKSKYQDTIGANSYKLSVIPVSISPFYSWAFYQKYPELAKDLEIKEQVDLQKYLQKFNTDSIQYKRGVFLIQEIAGTGKKPIIGCEISVHYTVKNMDGKILDSTIERNEPFSFILGKSGQVLKGFEIGIREMKLGEKSLLILPSKRGFGETGSTTGIVKGYQTLIYSVQIIEILFP